MSTAAAMKPCACGCGNPVIGRKFLNARHKQRSGPPKPKTYPHYISAEMREVKCSRHGNVVTEYLKRWQGMGVAGDWHKVAGCPDCNAEETARLERLQPKPSSNPCENLTCSCAPPNCPSCRHPMERGPNPSRGWHSWICDCSHHARVVVQDGIVAPATVAWGSGSQYLEKPWGVQCQ